jgi:hypothetical protein
MTATDEACAAETRERDMATYSQHQLAVANASTACERHDRILTDSAIAAGHGNVRLSDLRAMPEYADLFATIDAMRAILTEAQDAAIADHCAHRQGRYGDRFEWYSTKDARKFRADAKRRAA